MPEVSGFDLIQAVQDFSIDVPIVVMSSHDSQENVMQAFEAGAKDYLIKPIRRNEVSTLWQHIWRNGKVKAKSPTATHNASNGQTIASQKSAGSSDSESPKEGRQLDSSRSEEKGQGHTDPPAPLLPTPALPRNTSTLSAVHLDMPAKPLNESTSRGTESQIPSAQASGAQDMDTEVIEAKSKPKLPPSHLTNHSAFTAFTVFLPQQPQQEGQRKSQEASEEPTATKQLQEAPKLNTSVLPPVLPLVDVDLKISVASPSDPKPPELNNGPPSSLNVPLLGLPPMFQQYMLPPSVMQLLYTFQSNPNGIPSSSNPEITNLCFPVSGMNLKSTAAAPTAAKKPHSSSGGKAPPEASVKSPGSGVGSHMLCGGKPINGNALRQAAVARYLLKRKNRTFGKKVRYESRKKLADSRPRVKGMFVKRDPSQKTPLQHGAERETSVEGSGGSRDAAEALTLMDKDEDEEDMDEEEDEP